MNIKEKILSMKPDVIFALVAITIISMVVLGIIANKLIDINTKINTTFGISVDPEDAWILHTEPSRKDDSMNVYIAVRSEVKYEDGYPFMNIQCREGKTQFYFYMPKGYMTDHNNRGRVEYRIDQMSTKKWNMKESVDNNALGLWHGNGRKYISKIIEGDRISIWIAPSRRNPTYLFFNTSELTEYVTDDIRKHCDW